MAKSTEAFALLKMIKMPLLSVAKDLKDEIEYFLDNGVKPYIESQIRKFRKTNTFLFRSEKISFYDTYFPISVRSGKTTLVSDNEFVQNLFSNGNCTSIIGHAGTGKTMLTKHVFLTTVKSKIKIPILLELRFLNDVEKNLIDFINETIHNNELAPNKNILERILNEGLFLFILDGFDEIYTKNKQRIIFDLESFIDKHPNNLYLLTSRLGVSIESLARFENFVTLSLTEDQITEFVYKQVSQKRIVKGILETINKKENRDYKTYLSNPLLLSMFILTYNNYPELPRSKSKFYWNVFDTLCTKHDSITKKGGFQHERKTGLQNEDIERVVKWLGFVSLFEGKLYFDSHYLHLKLSDIKSKIVLTFDIDKLIYDLTVSVSILIVDGLDYRFPHKSLQEYFAVLLIKDQTEEIKSKIYEKKFARLEWTSFGGNENLWNLCLEMDKSSFLRFFALPVLEEIVQSIEGKDNVSKVKSFFNYIGYSVEVIFIDTGVRIHSIAFSDTLLINLLRFFGSETNDFASSGFYEAEDFKNMILELKSSDTLERGLDSAKDEHLTYDSWVLSFSKLNSSQISNYIELAVCKNALTVIDDAIRIVNRLKSEIANEERSSLDLLELN
jgi:hypothetical protein